MNGTLALALWLAWLAGVVGLALWRLGAVQHDKRERNARRDRQDHQESVEEAVDGFDPDETVRLVPLGKEYRQQLIAAGLLKPAEDQPQPEQPV